MSNVLSCWFWKKKNKKTKLNLRTERNNDLRPKSATNGPDLREIYGNHRKINAQCPKPLHRETSASLTKDPEYLERLFRFNSERKIRSYPSSPVRKLQTGSYSSDKNLEYFEDKRVTPHSATTTVYAACVPQNAGFFLGSTESEEPFPFHTPENAVQRRSTLFYRVKDDPRLVAEKPVEDYPVPSTYGHQYQFSHTMGEQEAGTTSADRKRVIINTSIMGNENVNFLRSNDTENTSMKSEAVRRTVVRLRPRSSGNFTPRESVKYMSVRAEQPHPPSELSKHVHKIPMKPPKQTPVLSTIDGRTLHPVSKDKVGRASLSVERESQTSRRSFDKNKIRRASMTSKGFTEPVRMSVVDPQTGESNFTDFARAPELQMVYAAPMIQTRRSVGRPSIRQSILHKDSVGERIYSSVLKENSKLQENHPFNQGDKNPVVYRVSPTQRFSYEDCKNNHFPLQTRQSKLNHKYGDDSSSETDQSPEVLSYRKKSRPSVLKRPRHVQQHAVYAAQIPIVTFTNHTTEKRKSSVFRNKEELVQIKPEPSLIANDYCGLSCERTEEKQFFKPQEKSNYMVDSSVQETDDDEQEMDLLCYPSEKFLKESALAAESGSKSKLRWRIIIKRGEEK